MATRRACCVAANKQQIAMFTKLINRAADEDRVRFNLIGYRAILSAAFSLVPGVLPHIT